MADSERWQQILNVASQIFMEKGYKGTTLDEIASNLSMTKAALYYYVSGKEELWIKCHIHSIDYAKGHIQPIYESSLPPDQKLFEMIKTHAQIVIETVHTANFTLFEKTFIPPSIPLQKLTEKRDNYEKMFAEVIEEGIEKKVFRTANVKIIRLIMLGSLNFIPNWYSPAGELSAPEIAEVFAEFLLKGILRSQSDTN